jgi:hypothetical protein
MQVVEIVNPSKKTGQGQYGQWNIAEVKLEDNKVVSVFGYPQLGQEVESLEFDQKYNSWKGKLVKGTSQAPQAAPLKDMSNPANVQSNEVLDGVRKVYAKLLEIEGKLDDVLNKPLTSDQVYATAQQDTLPDDDEVDKSVKLSDIPF